MQELSGETGITLAYAGKSRVAALRLTLHRDHPRVCGEKERTSRCACWTEGSPPRMRGKVTIAGYEVDVKGITPAYAGKRLCLSLSFAPLWDHPRVCGEKLCAKKFCA